MLCIAVNRERDALQDGHVSEETSAKGDMWGLLTFLTRPSSLNLYELVKLPTSWRSTLLSMTPASLELLGRNAPPVYGESSGRSANGLGGVIDWP